MDRKRAQKTIKKFSKRLAKEIKSNGESKEFEFVAQDNFWYFKFVVESGIYKGQIHIVEVKLHYGAANTDAEKTLYVYPMNPPLCRFITPIYHPNISMKGTICLDVLKDNWSPSMFSGTILSALKMLLLNPEPSSPQNKEAAAMMEENMESYEKKIHEVCNYDAADESIRKLF
jgi:ubiquitin-protein ligase